jgi:DNA modification methylase
METNKIYKGDAYKLIGELKDKSVDLIITDPPYDIKGIHGSGILRSRNVDGVKSFHKEIEQTNLHLGIDLKILDEYVRVLKKINIYIWCNREQLLPYIKYFVEEKGCNWELLIWGKPDPIPFCGTHYLVDKEYCIYFWETGATVDIPFERGKTVYLQKKNVSDKKEFKHPTIKPLNIIETLIQNSSKEGDLVLDTFVGSGTTCVASKKLNRQYIGFEINDEYYQIAIDRLNGINQKGQISLLDTNFDQISLLGENNDE